MQVATGKATAKGVVCESRVSHVVSSSTPVKLPDGARCEYLYLNVTPASLAVKYAAKMMITVEKGFGDIIDSDWTTKFSRRDLWRCS